MLSFSEMIVYICNMEKAYSDRQIGTVIFRKRKGIRRMSIRVHPLKGVSVTVPYLVPYSAALAFFRLKREWVLQTVARQKERYKDVPKAEPEQIETMRRQAKAELPTRLSQFAKKYGFTYNRVTIKHNSTNWGSCSARNNINLNLNIVRLPAPLRDYILLHELCHLRHHDHGHAFHLLLEHFATDNLLALCDEGDPDARTLSRTAVASKAQYPVDYVCSKALKAYPLI